MDEIDRKLLIEAEKGLLLTPQPFHVIAVQIGIPPQEVLIRLQRLQADGIIRRFGVSLKPDGVGFCANALVAWKVPQNRVGEVGEYFSQSPLISHCYEREASMGKWEYNLYTVMHAHERKTIEWLVKQFSAAIAVTDYLVLYSTRNLKTKSQEP